MPREFVLLDAEVPPMEVVHIYLERAPAALSPDIDVMGVDSTGRKVKIVSLRKVKDKLSVVRWQYQDIHQPTYLNFDCHNRVRDHFTE